METINHGLSQLRELFRSLTPGGRITAGLLLIVVVISLVYLFRYRAAGADSYLMGGEPFPAGQIPAMEAAFAKAGLSEYQLEGNRVRVPRGHHAEYMGALADEGALPPNFGSYLERALASDGIFESKHQKLERLKVARQNELALILRSMHGIAGASVLYDVKSGTGLRRDDVVTATVSLKPEGSQPIDARRVPMVRRLVAGAIAGLTPDNVTVADLNGRTYAGGEADGVSGSLEDPWYSRKQMYEQQLEEKVRGQLSMIPGILVQASADLDTELLHVEETEKFDPKTVPRRTKVRSSTNTRQGSSPGGRPGLAAQGPAGGAASVSAGRTTRDEEELTEEEAENLVNIERTRRELKGLTPKRVRLSVGIPSNYYAQVWREQNPTAAGAEPADPDPKDLETIESKVRKDIENAVVALLPPVPAGTDPFPQVTVTTFQSLTPEPLAGPSMAQGITSWLGRSWQALGMAGLAVFSLLVLRSIVNSAPAPEPVSQVSEPRLAVFDEPDQRPDTADPPAAEDDMAASRLRRRTGGPNLKEELSEMVREDPDAAASILRNWISAAG